jgi:hypothetical protein
MCCHCQRRSREYIDIIQIIEQGEYKMPRPALLDKASLDHVIESIQSILPDIKSDTVYERLLNVVSFLQDLKKGKAK